MKLRTLWRSAALLTLAAALFFALFCASVIAFTASLLLTDNNNNTDSNLNTIAQSLTLNDDGSYHLPAENAAALADKNRWAMLIGESGDVHWQLDKPADVPAHYEMTDVARFTRWYLADYPVTTIVRDDGLFIIGEAKGSIWKHDVAMATDTLRILPIFALASFLLMLAAVLAVSALLLRRWFRQDQERLDAVRADWIGGVSHDIRTPLSLVMGAASDLADRPEVDASARRQAGIIRSQSLAIRQLVGDLNLTMRLESAMQPLRRAALQPEALVRQAVADFLNSGMAEGYPLDIDLPETPLPQIDADAALLARALANLLTNAVRHNAAGCTICVGARASGRHVILYVESGAPAAPPAAPANALAPDGNAAHGTGLRLVTQIARAHGGEARFSSGSHFRCDIFLPI
ncbi:MAG: histidine kinase dimerization/phospho-acceptor domain-containing protein [Peptococcaceae bacterium]|nr:histidine kinase dimerization/phospho-acceptor domain-containing protein [Peptococcaceae bacterium]